MEKVNILKEVQIINDSVVSYEGLRPFLSTGNLNVSEIVETEPYTFNEKPSRANLNVKEGDLILARMKDTLKVRRISKNDEGLMVSTGFIVLRSKGNVDGNFLFHILKSENFQREKNLLCTGATQKAINNANFAKLKIPFPSLSTQKKIAEILDKAQEIIGYNQKTVEKYEELKRSLFLDMFGDPVKNEKGFNKDILGNYFKNGVKCGPFGSALKRGEFVEEGIPVWNMDNIENFQLKDNPTLFITSEKYSQLLSYKVEPNDIIISRAGTVGKMCVVNSVFKESIISTNLIRLSLDENKILPLYFVLLMKYFSNRIGKLKKGNEDAFTHMSTGVLTNLVIPIPPIELQNKFSSLIEEIETQKEQAKQALQKSEELFGSLLQKVFRGELCQSSELWQS